MKTNETLCERGKLFLEETSDNIDKRLDPKFGRLIFMHAQGTEVMLI